MDLVCCRYRLSCRTVALGMPVTSDMNGALKLRISAKAHDAIHFSHLKYRSSDASPRPACQMCCCIMIVGRPSLKKDPQDQHAPVTPHLFCSMGGTSQSTLSMSCTAALSALRRLPPCPLVASESLSCCRKSTRPPQASLMFHKVSLTASCEQELLLCLTTIHAHHISHVWQI